VKDKTSIFKSSTVFIFEVNLIISYRAHGMAAAALAVVSGRYHQLNKGFFYF
jgi:hypothetical protein